MGLQVITIQAINTKDAKGKWIDYANEHNLFGWTNAWAPYHNQWRDLYDASAFPIRFLIDDKGIIVSKGIVPEQIKEVIEINENIKRLKK